MEAVRWVDLVLVVESVDAGRFGVSLMQWVVLEVLMVDLAEAVLGEWGGGVRELVESLERGCGAYCFGRSFC